MSSSSRDAGHEASAVILFAHGSVLCGAGAVLEAHARFLRAERIADHVGHAFLNYRHPQLAEAVGNAVGAGANHVVVLPYFLAAGRFASEDVPRAVEPLRERYPAVRFTVGAALGSDERLAGVVRAAADSAGGPETWDAPVKQALDACERRSDCPLREVGVCTAALP